MEQATEAQHIARVTQQLRGAFPALDGAVVEAAVQRAVQRFADAPVREFIPVLVERAARSELQSIPTRIAG